MSPSSSRDEVTELKKTQEALKKSEEELKEVELLVKEHTEKILEREQDYRELYDSISEAFIATDWEFNVIHWNKVAEKITKVNAKEALGRKVYDVLPEMASIDVASYMESLQRKQPARFMMNTVSRATGRQAIFEISAYPSNRGITIIVEDKTDEENNKRLLAIGQTAGMVGHDIRNPLQAIIGDVYLLRSDLAKMPECATKDGVTESLDDIEKNVTYINKIVQDLQDYAKPIAPVPSQVNIEDVFKDVLVRKAIPISVQANYKIEPEASKIIIDPELLKRILANLVNNAVQAMPNGGRLDLHAWIENGAFKISVQDTGTGISEEIKPFIFSPLFTTKSKGQGFGLAAVKRLSEAMGWNISFESRDEKGTKFVMSMPNEKGA